MSPFSKTKEPVWISSDELARPSSAKLAKKDIEDFLDWLFSDVARKPEPMLLREAASVAKYLWILAGEEEPGLDRQVLEYLSKVIWGTALREAPIALSDKRRVVSFLERHTGTHLPAPSVGKALSLVRERGTPKDPPRSPRLASRGMSIEGVSVAGLQDDLSERIYGAYWALRQAKVHGARKLVAKVLNAKGLKRASRGDSASTWDSDTVYDRVKQFEDRQSPKARRTEKALQRTRTTFPRKWVDAFRCWREVEEQKCEIVSPTTSVHSTAIGSTVEAVCTPTKTIRVEPVGTGVDRSRSRWGGRKGANKRKSHGFS